MKITKSLCFGIAIELLYNDARPAMAGPQYQSHARPIR
jgi:hypothetical protein